MGDQKLAARARAALDAGEGILRLAPTWVPRSFLMPGGRLKLSRDDLYALGTHRGGIDERWFASTTAAANEGAPPDEGLSYVVHDGDRFTLKEAIAENGAEMIGASLWDTYKRWPVYSKFFDNLGPIPHHMHQNQEQAAKLGREGKPESYYFPPQLNWTGNNFPYTFFGLEPGTAKSDLRRCLERWNLGDNGILDLSKAYRLKPGTGWLVPPDVLHAPGSLVTYEPQWGSDVFGMYQSMVEGRRVPWELLVKDVPPEYHQDLDYLVEQLDWEKNVDPEFKKHNYLEPIIRTGGPSEGLRRQVDRVRPGRRQAALQRLRADRGTGEDGHDQGPGRLRPDRRPGQRHDRQPGRRQPELHPLRRGHPGRGLRHGQAGRRGRHVQEHRQRAVRQPPLLRARHAPGLAERGRPPESEEGMIG